MNRHLIRRKTGLKPIAAFLLAASLTLSAHAQDLGGLLKSMLGNRAPNTQNLLGAVRSITQVSQGRVADDVRVPQDAEGRVILYRTAWCGYCKQAAAYMQRKAIPFLERDIEASAANNAEYRQFGGNGGVPLIVFGQTTMQGFEPARFDRSYAEFQRTIVIRPGADMIPSGMPPAPDGSFPPRLAIEAGDPLVGKIGGVPVYAQASKSAPVLARLNKTEEVVYMGEEKDGLYRVTATVGEGWVDKLLVKKH